MCMVGFTSGPHDRTARAPVARERGEFRASNAYHGPMLLRSVALLALLAACRAPAGDTASADTLLPRGPTLALPPTWRTMSSHEFELWTEETLPEQQATPIDKAGLRDLAAALDEMNLDSVRAAVILGRSRYPTSATILIRRLERRTLGPARHSDCGDTLAAAALARFPDPRRYAQRLVPLAVGPYPHPDLETRVECAATALYAGFDQCVPFLLQVLRIDTPAGLADARDFAVSPTTAWARGRAAEALSQYAGVPVTYRFDGPLASREAEAQRLAERLTLQPVPEGGTQDARP